jgi:proteasome lid subunit RPN8/RPN11
MTISNFRSTAGPRQTKKATQALEKILSRGKCHIELTGVQGVNENRSELWTFGDETCDDANRRFEEIGERYEWEISKTNFKQIETDALQAVKDIVLPVVDNRRSQDDERERLAAAEQQRQSNAKRSAEKSSQIDIEVEKLRKKYPNAKPEGEKSDKARAAANIRMELKAEFPRTKFSVRSRSASMMSAVDVYWTDGPTADAVDTIIEKYQTYGGMDQTDYATTKSDAFSRAVRIVLGSAKYVSSHRKISDEIEQAADPFFTDEIFASRRQEKWSQSEHLGRILHSSDLRGSAIVGIERADNNAGYVVKMSTKPAPTAQPATADESYKIVKHHHTKKRIDFYIAVPVEHMDRELYLSELDRAKTFGGWKSRKWGKSPSGFGFETSEAAHAFANVEPTSDGKTFVPINRISLVRETGLTTYAKISSSDDACRLFSGFYKRQNYAQEVVTVATLDTKNNVLGITVVTVGTLDASLIHPREVFIAAIQQQASSILVAHNHPSGDPTPSREDRAVHQQLKDAGKLLGVDVLDHIVVGDHSFDSVSIEETN